MKKTAILLIITVITSCTRTITRLSNDESAATTILSADSLSASTHKDSVSLEKKAPPAPGKYIYLTIDDAPLNGSKYIDSVILSTKVKTNIFLVGNPINESKRFKRYHEILEENPFIELYNHSYSHANHTYANYYKNPAQVVSDFEKNDFELNLHHRIARLPGRNLWQLGNHRKNYKQSGAEAAALLAEKGYKIFGWDVEWKYDPKDHSPRQTVDELIDEIECFYNTSGAFTPNHIVLLMHDQMFVKTNGENDLSKLIRKLKEKDFTFEYLSDYPEPDR